MIEMIIVVNKFHFRVDKYFSIKDNNNNINNNTTNNNNCHC